MSIRKVLNTIQAARRSCFIDSPGCREVVFLAASGRSGSTWLQDIISSTGSYRVIFEPFHSQKMRFLDGWAYRQYMAPESQDSARREQARQIIEGRVRGRWTDQDNRTFLPKRRLIKDIRANLLLAWLKRQFPYIRLIYLLRSPFSVAESRMRLGWDCDLEGMLEQQPLVDDHFTEQYDFLRAVDDPFVKQLAFWAMENVVPLRDLRPEDALVVMYENLLAAPESEGERVAQYSTGREASQMQQLAGKASRTSWKSTGEAFKPSTKQIDQSLEVLQRLGLDKLYSQPGACQPALASDEVLTSFSRPK